jgi:LysR family transcriptional activator of nhaA
VSLNYNHLYYFHVAAIEGSVSAAAHRLGVTPATVSEQVRALERTLAVDLFERSQSGLRLTESGRLAFEHTAAMFVVSDRLVEALGRGAETIVRTLRVGVSAGTARSTTTDFLMPLLTLDDCVPTIRVGETAELLRDLRGGQLDLVLCESVPPGGSRPGLEVVQIDRSALVAVARPDLEPAPDWQDVRLVQYRATSAYRWDVEAFLDKRGLKPRIAAEADDSQFLIEAASRGCVAVVPRATARDALLAGRLRVIAQIESANAGVHALYQDTVASDLARRAVEVLIASVRANDDTSQGQ